MSALAGKVAVVTGASRGAGRAIAAVLGERGATVYVTGRSTRGGATTEGLPGTIEDAADEVAARGGAGIPVRVDHTVDAEVAALFARVGEEQGRLDLLVNNAWGGYEGAPEGLPPAPFWKTPLDDPWRRMFEAGLRAALVASAHAVPLMLPRRAGLVVHTVAWSYGDYIGDLMYDVAKAALVRAASSMGRELELFGLASVALAPGFMRTERVMAAHARHPFDLSGTESPEYLGRAVAALAEDPDVRAKNGQALTVGDLAREYGFTDTDGTQPPAFRMPEAWQQHWRDALLRSVEADLGAAATDR